MSKAKNLIKVVEPPRIPTLSFNKPSVFPGQAGGFVPKKPQAKFNQSTFHTQHKGGPSGGK